MKSSSMAAMIVILLLLAGLGAYILTGNNDTSPETKTFTASEVATHDKVEDCWTIIDGNVYDLTSFISGHPGGDEILQACGIDATSLFLERETADGEEIGSGTPHSGNAQAQLQSLKTGTLAE